MKTSSPQQTENVMLLTEYKEHSDKINFPAIVQQKIDGHRCIYLNGKFYGRSGSELKHPSLQRIADELAHIPSNMAIDGEIQHVDGTYLSTGKINGFDDTDEFKFYAFDCLQNDASEDSTYIDRYKWVACNVQSGEYAICLPVALATSKECVDSMIIAALSMGHEGIVIKNINGKYTFGRSTDVQKLKTL